MAIESLKKVKQPSSSTVAKLAKLYPSSSSRPMRRLADTFDPLQECVALPAKRAKKAARVKPVTVEVIVLPASHSMILPRGKQRHTLANSGRVKNVQFKRTMSFLQVKNVIVSSFPNLNMTTWEFLEVRGGKLEKSTSQEPAGEICQRRGAIYIKQQVLTALVHLDMFLVGFF